MRPPPPPAWFNSQCRPGERAAAAAAAVTRRRAEAWRCPPLDLSRASLLTLYRFSGSLLLGLILNPRPCLLPRLLRTLLHAHPFFLPALLLFVANHTTAVALDRLNFFLACTSKCAIPLVTVLLTLSADGSRRLPRKVP